MIEMARKLCIDCNTRNADPTTPEGQLCIPCETYAGWENTHNDRGHDDIDTYSIENTIFNTQAEVDAYITDTKDEMTGCPVCHPKLDPRNAPVRRGTSRVGMANTPHKSHAGCHHMATPKARAMCRKAGGPGSDGSLKLFPAPAPREVIFDLRDHSMCNHTPRGNGACVARRKRERGMA